MLSLENVFKTYVNGPQTLHALNDVTLHFKAGDFAFILGASGSGKSTLLNVLSGLDVPSQGHVVIDGIDTRDFSRKDWAIYRNHYVGFVFQEYNLIEHLSVLDNVALPLIFQGVSRQDAQNKAKEELDRIGLIKHIDKKPAQLSGGQQQRVSIARALVTDPKIIMADEPTGALDEEMGIRILSYLRQHAKDKVVIVVTHDEDLAKQFSNRTIRIQDGVIQSDQRPTESDVKADKTLELSTPRMRLGMLIRFAKNNIASRIGRSIFTSAVVSIGFIAILLLTFIVLGITGSISDTIGQLIPPEEYQIQPIENVALTDQNMADISAINNVGTVRYIMNEPFLTDYPQQPRDQKLYFNYTAVPLDPLAFERDHTLYGRQPESFGEVVVNLQAALSMLGLSAGDDASHDYIFDRINNRTLTIQRMDFDETNGTESFVNLKTFTVVGLHTEQGYVGTVYVEYNELLVFLDGLNNSTNHRQIAVATLHDTSDDAIETLSRTLRDDYQLYLTNMYREITQQVESTMHTALKWFIGVAAITLVVSSILIGLMIHTSVLERIKEIGILTAVGARQSNIRSIFIIESGLIGFISSLIATGVAIFVAMGLNNLFQRFIQAPLNLLTGARLNIELFSPNVIAIGIVVLFSVFYAMLSGLIPSFFASRLDAIKALRKE